MNDVVRAGAFSLLLAACPAQAQLAACALPETVPAPHADRQSASAASRIVPVDAYILALSWSPQYCEHARKSDIFQCETNKFGFVLHGLWPQGRDGTEPEYCRPARSLSVSLLRSNLCATPSANLLQHEWAKHGTCMTSSPQRYFDQARGAYGKMRFPDMGRLATTDGLTVGQFTSAFVSANERGLTPRGMKVRLDREGWLQEVQICLDRQLRFAACGKGRAWDATPTRPMRIRPKR